MATDIRIKEQLPELTRRIVETYHDVPTIHYLGHCPLPNYEAIDPAQRTASADATASIR